MVKNRNLMFWVAFGVPLLALAAWFAVSGPPRCNAYRNMGFVHLAEGAFQPSPTALETAERWFGISLRDDCPAAPASYGLAHARAAQGRRAAAAAAFEGEIDRGELRRFLAGRSYEALGRTRDALREYRMLPRDAAAHFNGLALDADRRGDFAGALDYFAISRMINPSAPKAYYGAAFVYWRRLGEEDRAIAMIEGALAVDRRASAERDFYRGLLCYNEDRIDCATQAWASAIRRKPRNDSGFEARFLAYEMLSRAQIERGPAPSDPLGAPRLALRGVARSEAW